MTAIQKTPHNTVVSRLFVFIATINVGTTANKTVQFNCKPALSFISKLSTINPVKMQTGIKDSHFSTGFGMEKLRTNIKGSTLGIMVTSIHPKRRRRNSVVIVIFPSPPRLKQQ